MRINPKDVYKQELIIDTIMIDLRKPQLCSQFNKQITKYTVKDYFKLVRAEEGIKVKLAAGMRKFIKNIETKKRERLLNEKKGRR